MSILWKSRLCKFNIRWRFTSIVIVKQANTITTVQKHNTCSVNNNKQNDFKRIPCWYIKVEKTYQLYRMLYTLASLLAFHLIIAVRTTFRMNLIFECYFIEWSSFKTIEWMNEFIDCWKRKFYTLEHWNLDTLKRNLFLSFSKLSYRDLFWWIVFVANCSFWIASAFSSTIIYLNCSFSMCVHGSFCLSFFSYLGCLCNENGKDFTWAHNFQFKHSNDIQHDYQGRSWFMISW